MLPSQSQGEPWDPTSLGQPRSGYLPLGTPDGGCGWGRERSKMLFLTLPLADSTAVLLAPASISPSLVPPQT